MASTSGVNMTVSVVLHTERHARLVEYVNRHREEHPGSLSALFRAALEVYIDWRAGNLEREQSGSLTVEEVEAACRRAVEAALKGRVVGPEADDSGLMTISAETQTKGRLAQMREALDQWGEEG